MRILLTRRIPSSVLNTLEAAHDVEIYDGPGAMPPDELRRRIAGRDALICLLTDRISDDVLEAGDRLKVVANIAVGYENIDVAAAKRRGIVVTNTPDVLTEAVAEFTWGLILTAARRIGEGERLVRRGGWKGWALDFMLGSELRGKQLGIIGHGRIGRAVAAKAPAFGMDVVFASRGAASPGPGRFMSLDELLVTSDIVSIHAPATAATRHLIGRKELARMKRTALLVNTARGSIVDEDALAWGLGEPPDCRRGPGRVRARAAGVRAAALSGECRARAAPGQRDARDPHGHGRSRRAQRAGRA
ncbi:D-glycerate dehydrogenase [soil metagenome]